MVQRSDTTELRSLLGEDLGILSWWVTLDPSSKDVFGNIFITEKEEGIEVTIALRLRNTKIIILYLMTQMGYDKGL